MPNSALIARVHRLEESVTDARRITSNDFRSKLCDLIRDIPPRYPSLARELCRSEACPLANSIVAHLQQDVEANEDNPEYAAVLYPMLRVALMIRTAEVVGTLPARP